VNPDVKELLQLLFQTFGMEEEGDYPYAVVWSQAQPRWGALDGPAADVLQALQRVAINSEEDEE
jgi:hypothetical protein